MNEELVKQRRSVQKEIRRLRREVLVLQKVFAQSKEVPIGETLSLICKLDTLVQLQGQLYALQSPHRRNELRTDHPLYGRSVKRGS